jgi:hypothetical protein
MNLGKKIQKIRKKFKNSKKDNRNLCVEPKLVMCTGVENVGLPHKSKATSTPSLPVSAVHCEDILHTRPRPLVSQYDSVHESVVTLTLSRGYQRPFLGLKLNVGHGGAVVCCT